MRGLNASVVFALLLLALVAAFVAARAQVPEEKETGTPLPAEKLENTAAPDLLPRADALPEPPATAPANVSRALRSANRSVSPMAPSPAPRPTPFVSEAQRRQDEQRLNRIRALAMRDRQVIALLRLAGSALSVEARRNYLRAYYVTLCTRMRDMDPRLTRYIWEFEQDQIRAVGRTKNPQVPKAGKE